LGDHDSLLGGAGKGLHCASDRATAGPIDVPDSSAVTRNSHGSPAPCEPARNWCLAPFFEKFVPGTIFRGRVDFTSFALVASVVYGRFEDDMATTLTADGSRRVMRKQRGQPTSDGAGVRMTRVIGTPRLDHFDPFLLLDEFRSDDPNDY